MPFWPNIKKFGNFDIHESLYLKKGRKLALSKVFLKSIKKYFWPEKWRISFIFFYNWWGNICGLYSSEKRSKKQCFLILSLFSHNLTGKLIFSQKKWVRHIIWFAFCFWCFQMLFLMLLNYTFDALLHGQSIQSIEIERHRFRETQAMVGVFLDNLR